MKQNNYFPKLDHLRFYAAFLVIIAHSFPVPKAFGNSGVSLFMVLSGFILTIIVQAGNKEITYKYFIFKRFIRIYPLYTLLFFVMLSLGRRDFHSFDLFSLILFQSNLSPSGTGFGHDIIPISGPSWTIAVEFQFYLIFPFLILFLKRYGVRYLFNLIVFFLFLRTLTSIAVDKDYWEYYHTILGRIDQFIIGIILGWLFVTNKKILGDIGNFLLFCFSVTALILFYRFDYAHNPIYSLTLEGLFYAGIIWGYFLSRFTHLPSFLNSTLAIFGKISYSTYLLHILILLAFGKLHLYQFVLFSDPFINKLTLFIFVVMPTILFISYLSYHLIEKPFLSFGKKYTH